MSAGNIRAGRAYVEIFGDDSKLVRTLKSSGKSLKDWGKSVAGIGAAVLGAGTAILGPLSGAAKMFAEMGSDMADMSGRTGASVEALSSLGYAAEQSGASIEDLEGGLRKQAKFLTEAAQGGKAQVDVLKQLGLSVADLAKLSPEDQFRLLSERINGIQNPTARAAMAMEVFGKTGTKLLPMIGQLGELEARARELGLVMSSDDAAAADTLGDAWGDLLGVGKMLVFQVGAALAPMLSDLVSAAINIASSFIGLVQANRETIVTVAKIAAVVMGAGAALVALGGLLTAAGVAVSALASVVAFCGSVLGAIAGAFMFLISPVGLVIAALAGLVTWFFTCTETGQAAVGAIGEAFRELWDIAGATLGGIRDALAAGDLAQAATVAWAGIKLAWLTATAGLREMWINFKHFFMQTWAEASTSAAAFFLNAIAAIESGWEQTVGFLADAWNGWISILTKAWNEASGILKKDFAIIKGLFDSSFDVKAEFKKIDAETNKKNEASDDALGEKTLARQKAREATLAKIEADRIGSLAALQEAKDEETTARALRNADDIAAAQNNLADAKAAFQQSVDAAAEKRLAIETGKTKDGKGNKLFDFEVPDLRAGLAAAKTAVSGTFSAAAAAGLGGARQLDQIATATQQTAKGVKQLINKKGGLVAT